MTKKILFWFFTISIVFLSRILVQKFFSIGSIFPDILLIATLYCGMTFGMTVGVTTGFVWGLLADFLSLSLFGSQSFVLILLGFGCGHLKGKIDEERPIVQFWIAFSCSWIKMILLFCLIRFFGDFHPPFWVFKTIAEPVYTAIFCPLLFFLFHRWISLFSFR